MQKILVARNLTKFIGRRRIVDAVSFELRQGEIFGFLGPNGAGKTTTIRMLAGLIRPSGGSVEICGFDLRRQFEHAMRNVGCIVETPDLYRFLTGRQNLEHFARMLGPVDPAEIERLAGLVALAGRLDERVSTYSLGMRQRLGIAQALLGEPRLLILDEPVNGLDPAGIHEMRGLLRQLADERGMAIFVSSHLLSEIELVCDRVAIIHHGKIVAEGTIDDLLRSAGRLAVEVDRPAEAARYLTIGGIATTPEGGSVRIDTAADPHDIVTRLIDGGFRITSVRPFAATLEEMFLDITHGRTVDE